MESNSVDDCGVPLGFLRALRAAFAQELRLLALHGAPGVISNENPGQTKMRILDNVVSLASYVSKFLPAGERSGEGPFLFKASLGRV